MTSNRELWEELFSKPGFKTRYPSEAVVRWTFRTFPRRNAAEIALLDCGCGAGRHALFFAGEGYNAAAVDFSERAISDLCADAKSRELAIDARIGEPDALPFADASFDGVLSFGVLYYLSPERFAASIAEIHRVLKPDGQAFIMVKTPGDSRRHHAAQVSPDIWRVTGEPVPGAWPADIGMDLTLLHRDRFSAMLAPFSQVEIDCSTVTSNNGSLVAEEWYGYARK